MEKNYAFSFFKLIFNILFRYTIREEILTDGVKSDLSIKRTERIDTAVFTCVATNSFGSDDSSIQLIVQGSVFYILNKKIIISILLVYDCSERNLIL